MKSKLTNKEKTFETLDLTSNSKAFCFGRGRRIRTRDPRFWRPVLYQLSYTPVQYPIIIPHLFEFCNRFCENSSKNFSQYSKMLDLVDYHILPLFIKRYEARVPT